jgi:hypothetical protein
MSGITDFQAIDTETEELRIRLTDLEDLLFDEYVPAKEGKPFKARLKAWLAGVGSDEDERLLLKMLENLYFVGQKELDVLYRQVFRTDITWWLSPNDLLTDTATFDRELAARLDQTWFCPLTDSMNIAHFHHVNGIRDRNLRPEWRILAKFADPMEVRQYIASRDFQRLVLLEDFVGTGTQTTETIEWTLTNFPELDLLICPLVVCRKGLEALVRLTADSSRASVRPGVVVPDCCQIGLPPADSQPPNAAELRDLLTKIVGLVGASDTTVEKEAFGFGEMGVLSVLYTNCPNNAPPALHHNDTKGWDPLFPRSVRV